MAPGPAARLAQTQVVLDRLSQGLFCGRVMAVAVAAADEGEAWSSLSLSAAALRQWGPRVVAKAAEAAILGPSLWLRHSSG